MDGSIRARIRSVFARARRVERRELREFRRWIEHTGNLLHVSVLIFVPLLIGLVTYLSNATRLVSFLLFPPLASGTYTLFADPEGEYSSPGTFVGGMTLGALSGWVSLAVFTGPARQIDPATGLLSVHAGAAALAIFLTGVLTWALDVEEPTAFSTTLLILLIGGQRLEYVLGIALSSAFVASVFVLWRERFYEQRARFLYRSTSGDDRVLVPMRGDHHDHEAAALFGARLAAAHETGKVVLLDVVDDAATARAERAVVEEGGHEGTLVGTRPDGGTDPTAPSDDPPPARDIEELEANDNVDPEQLDPATRATLAERRAVAESATELEDLADEIERAAGVRCEVVVAVAEEGWSPSLVADTLREAGCDVVVTPYEENGGRLSEFVGGLFDLDTDVVAFRSTGDPEWSRAMVAVRRAGDVAHAMIDFARRATGPGGRVSVCHCINRESDRRRSETMLSNLVDAFRGEFETRVANAPIEEFLSANAPGYDLVVVGASTDRSTASRFVAPPTFERVGDVDADVAIVHRGR